ncbi:hypothetical protein [Trichoplusia ni ascovirus 6b]|nr:hypothetical protein [Trichoplusia ni ascovirus 6b]
MINNMNDERLTRIEYTLMRMLEVLECLVEESPYSICGTTKKAGLSPSSSPSKRKNGVINKQPSSKDNTDEIVRKAYDNLSGKIRYVHKD